MPKWELFGGKDNFPLIEGLSKEEKEASLAKAGAKPEEIQQLLERGEEARDTINRVILRQWEDDPGWASQILDQTLKDMGIREEEK